MKFTVAALLGLIAVSTDVTSVNAIQISGAPVENDFLCTENEAEKKGWKNNLPGFYKDTKVTEYDGAKAVSFLTSEMKQPALVIAYHPQCPHCKTIVDDVTQLAADVSANKVGASVDAINMSTLSAQQSEAIQVNSYPTIRLYTTPGQFVKYNGERTEAGYMAFLANNGVKINASLAQKQKEKK